MTVNADTQSVEMVLDAKVYVYVDLEGRTVTHVEIDFDRQPHSCDPPASRDEAWTIALGKGHAAWPPPVWT